ncbi:MAG: winged helix-turn-helix transcriptional regulator [Desulfobaccales bacterium]|nr:winged helix-turn-helix transcriptional regulator [Desulfobaccales bacterium]
MDDPILEYNILDAVHENEGRLTQRHISQKLGRSVSSVNFALRLLAVKGYIKISGANPRNLRYNLTPRGILQKSILAYDFLKRQSALYEEVRKNLLEKLRSLAAQDIQKVAVYGWTPFTEAAILFLISSGIQVTAIYADFVEPQAMCSRIPLRPIDEFQDDCEVLVLMQPLPKVHEEKIPTGKVVCFPGPR